MKKLRSSWMLVLFIATGVVLGSLIGNFFASAVPFLNYGPAPLGLNNIEINLGVIYFQITLLLKINVASLIGLLLSVVIFNRL
ncbi:DUF4321 domain-containing protein [Alkaliphilus oremlandii]|uniref:DUF4321 domain-containing protein n=1 Tax=Alkaliphilus oremlandii (strain OhILAs) TaxID=350688 RepID=A8MHM6_ALKOO|nr:DUF4321 domain-containing protein [Alkaliphilus oremlandii]ABW19308.1 hypothetical protein Clos_1768 [Alkaliphilus oremlandii OhILAs]